MFIGCGHPVGVRRARTPAATAAEMAAAHGTAARRHRAVIPFAGACSWRPSTWMAAPAWRALVGTALLFAPWIAVATILRQRDAAGARAGIRLRARAQRVRAPCLGRAPAPAAGAGGAALPVQHAGQRAGAGRFRFAAGVEGAHEPHRLSTRGRAAHAVAVDRRSTTRCSSCAPTSSSCRCACRTGCSTRSTLEPAAARAVLPADDAAHAGRERGAPRHRSERDRRPHRCRHLDARQSLRDSREGHGRGLEDRRAAAWARVCRRCASA